MFNCWYSFIWQENTVPFSLSKWALLNYKDLIFFKKNAYLSISDVIF